MSSSLGFSLVESDANATFAEELVCPISGYSHSFKLSDDGGLLIWGMNLKMHIFRKNGSNCLLEQTFTRPGNTISVDLSADEKEIVSCHNDLHFFRHDGAQFVFSQNISLGFNCQGVNFIDNMVLVHGTSTEVRFYEFNGSEYVPKFTLPTNDSSIKKISIAEDESQIMFGGDSQNVSAYTLNSGIFQLSEQLETSVPIQELFVDLAQLYFVPSTSQPALKVFFRCPD